MSVLYSCIDKYGQDFLCKMFSDNECDNIGEEKRAIELMRKKCPFVGKLL